MEVDNQIDSDSSVDSDTELQQAFADGKLKPGLNVRQVQVKKKFINDVAGLELARSDLYLQLDWLQRLDVTVTNDRLMPTLTTNELDQQQHSVDDIDVNDDFKREMNFYRQAQLAVLEAIPKLHKSEVVTKRPADYYAEMCKSEKHMKRVREKLVEKRSRIEHKEKMKKLRDLKKQGKKIQQEVLLQRQKEKRALLQSVKKYRKKQDTGDIDKDDSLAFLNDKQDKSHAHASAKKSRHRREFKNKKFGFGGRKKGSKHNTARTSASMVSFSGKVHQPKQGKALLKKNINQNKKKKRPGKQQRQKLKGRH